MATSKPRFSITLDADLFDRIDIYQHQHRLPARSVAIVELIEKGMDALEKQTGPIRKEPRLTPEELDLVEKYRRITKDQQTAVKSVLNSFYNAYLVKEEPESFIS